MPKELNDGNDEAATEIVVAASTRCGGKTVTHPTYDELGPEERSFADRLLALARAGRDEGEPDATSDHGYLYDSHGAPK